MSQEWSAHGNVFGESHVHSIPDSLLKIVLILVNVFGESHVHSIPENCFDIDQVFGESHVHSINMES
jgi:hypothetical protein